MIERKDIVQAARKYLGVRYLHQGRSPAGLDCLGLLVLTAKDLNYKSEDSVDYAKIPDGKILRAGIERNLEKSSGLQLGNVLLMKFESNPQHLAILTDIGIIHSYAYVRKVVEHRLDSVWKSRIVAEYSMRGIA